MVTNCFLLVRNCSIHFNNFPRSTLTQLVVKYFVVHLVKRLGKVKVNDIVVIAIQKTLDDVVNVLKEMG